MWDETWQNIRIELAALQKLVERESTTDRLRAVLISVAKHCVQATKLIGDAASDGSVGPTAVLVDVENLERSLFNLDKELDAKISRKDSNDVHGMLRLTGLIVRQAARSLLHVSAIQNKEDTTATQYLTVQLCQRLTELSSMLNNVHDERSANLLNNYSLGTLVQRITEEMARDTLVTSGPGGENGLHGLMKDISMNFDERHRHSALVLSVLSILRTVR